MSETREVSVDTLAEMVVEIDGLYRDIEWHRRVISHQTLSFRDGLSQRDDEIAQLRDEVERLRLRTLNEGLQEENDDASPNFCLPEEFRKGAAFATACAEEEIERLNVALKSALSDSARLSLEVARLREAAELVVAGWDAGRIKSNDAREDAPDGDLALAGLDDALKSEAKA